MRSLPVPELDGEYYAAALFLTMNRQNVLSLWPVRLPGPDGKLHGDVDFEHVKDVASFITPVPRGVGPVTVAALMENVVRAAEFAHGLCQPGYDFSVAKETHLRSAISS